MKISFFNLEEWAWNKVKEWTNNLNIEVKIYKNSINDVNVEEYKDSDIISTDSHSKLDKNILEKLDNLKFIITRTVGIDHIDLNYCKERNIKVYNIPDYGSRTVAEFTFMLILMLLKNYKKIEKSLREDLIINPYNIRGYDLQGLTLGVVGTGRIGTEVIKIAKGFDMNIIAYNKSIKQDLIEKYNVKFVSFEDLLKNSDIITLHLPLTNETYHIINKNNINLIKRGAYLINVSRGSLIETEALIEALEKGILSGVALDVVEGEELIRDELDILNKNIELEKIKKAFLVETLMKFDNVIITPHIAYNTWNSVNNILNKTLNTIEEILKGNYDLYNKIL
ncbi:lactate dehydrogenase [Nanoarchaeota archaeon]